MIENEDFLHKILTRKISFEVRFVGTFRPLRPSLDWASYWALSGRGRSSIQWTVVSSQHSDHRHRPPHRLVTSTQIVTLSDNTCIPYSLTTGDISDKNNHEHSLDTDCRLPLCRDWSHSSSSRALYFHQVLFDLCRKRLMNDSEFWLLFQGCGIKFSRCVISTWSQYTF